MLDKVDKLFGLDDDSGSDAADRILERYATLYGNSGPAQTRDEYQVAAGGDDA